MNKDESSKIVFETEWFSIEEVPYNERPYYRLSCNDSVEILAVTNDKKIILVRQFRPALGMHMLELPAGYIDETESKESAVERELREETGFICDSTAFLGSFKIKSSRINNTLNFFYGKGAKLVDINKNKEKTEVVLVTFDEFEELIIKGEFIEVAGFSIYFLAKLKGFI